MIPVVYFGLLIIAPLLYPGFNYATQYASEMGSTEARYPAAAWRLRKELLLR